MTDELKPCPFCGGEAKLKHGYRRKGEKFGNKAYVQCKKCGCKTLLYSQSAYERWQTVDEIAIHAWNQRCKESVKE